MAKDRIVIDTILWISFLLRSGDSTWDRLIFSTNTTLLFSQELLDEFVNVAQRPKFRKYFSNLDLETLLPVLKQHADFIMVTSSVTACRDPNDNFLLALCEDGRATHLLTGDLDLLDLKKFGKNKNYDD